MPEKYIQRDEFDKEFQHQIEKSKAVAELIGAYMTNGDELPNTIGRPIGSKIMREALCNAEFVGLSEKTLFNYYKELEYTAVFHYLMRFHYCKPVLNPLDHYDKKFPSKIMQRARSVDEFRGVCSMYNTAVAQLNEKYRFNFIFIKDLPESESETRYDALIKPERNKNLTEAIRTVTGRTA